MDLIHADAKRTEVGAVDLYISLDACIQLGGDLLDNSFEVTLDDFAWSATKPVRGHYLYVPGTEWGGMIDVVKHNTEQGKVTLTGATWRGMLARKVVAPPAGHSHWTVSYMEANQAVALLMGNALGDLFRADTKDTGVVVSGSYRYATLLGALEDLLASAGMRLYCKYDQAERAVLIGAAPVVDYASDIDLSQDYGIHLVSTHGRLDAYNHIIALGRGELEDREVIHVYRAADGTITTEKPDGWDDAGEHVVVYDYSNAESTEELINGAIERLMEYAEDMTLETNTAEIDTNLELGDIVGARDRLTGLVARARVSGKILTVDDHGAVVATTVVPVGMSGG